MAEKYSKPKTNLINNCVAIGTFKRHGNFKSKSFLLKL
jgi:hypothetical protein